MTSCNPNFLLKAPSPSTIPMHLGLQHRNLGGGDANIQSIMQRGDTRIRCLLCAQNGVNRFAATGLFVSHRLKGMDYCPHLTYQEGRFCGSSLVVWWLGFYMSIVAAWVPSLV